MALSIPSQSLNAIKYGPWSKDARISGLTPLTPLFPRARVDPEELALRNQIEDFQREKFEGFTSRELADMDVITDRKLKDSTLENPIMPLLRIQRWELRPHQPDLTRNYMYPLMIDGEQHGDWSMHNPLVYEKMKPVLQLATRTIISMYTLPWFAALIFGKRAPIDPARVRPHDELPDNTVSFLPYNIGHYDIVRAKMIQIFYDLEHVWNLKLGFMAPGEDPRGPEYPLDPDDKIEDDVYGLTVTNYSYMMYDTDVNRSWKLYIFLNYTQLDSLFRNDLTTTERKTVEWASAVTLVHEIVHAINFVCPRIDGSPVQNPDDENPPWFYDQEALAEVGYSFEAALNGGTVRAFIDKPGMPYGHWFQTVWPTVEGQHLCGSKSLTLTQPDPFTYQEEFPIPVSFYEDIQQRNFWECVVHKFGHKLFHYRTLSHGTRINFKIHRNNKQTPIKFAMIDTGGIGPVNHDYGGAPKVLVDRWLSVLRIRGMGTAPETSKLASNFGQALLDSSLIDNSFWTKSQSQRQSVDIIFDHLRKESRSIEETVARFGQLIDFISIILRNHENTIDALFGSVLVVVRGIEVPTEQRRKTLLSWNRGTGKFINECGQQEYATPQQKQQLTEELIALERCRMRLFSPDLVNETIRSGPDFEELRLLLWLRDSYLRDQVDACDDYCNQLENIDECSLFPSLCAQLIRISIYEGSEVSEDRISTGTELQNLIAVYEKLKSRCPESWVDMFRVWDEVVGIAVEIIRGVREM
ncbi:hypothetical protein sscle_09g069160 [Sclerotinia sclerotiorum 1980 UF-70]|uniref:Uncharacterized protein n=1 Tax=Sclerotinia sclerotiorum (strain ATCC 18683 / 1980 / Ss-1) TaxID=665079 RepID=A0A1D9QB42_SCLS1|nr:hypothetical protein sscle_09g069160 [Sclerotinia sclerotiorum 1980 UF-70]